jgi:hypothetical protein
MKAFICILLCFILTNCNAQDSEFKTYLSNFGQGKLPLSIFDRQSSYAVLCQRNDTLLGMMPKVISEKSVEKYICTKGFCNPHGGYFRYDYGIKIDLNSAYTTVLVSKLQYEGDTEWDFDLGEILLITYNTKGEILSRQSLTKDNDRWQSNLKITKDGITVRQFKVTESKIDQYHRDLHCEFSTTEYQVTDDGIIKTTGTSSVSTGILVWDKSAEDYKLKE